MIIGWLNGWMQLLLRSKLGLGFLGRGCWLEVGRMKHGLSKKGRKGPVILGSQASPAPKGRKSGLVEDDA